MYDVIVIGRGPAGVSSAIYAVRAGKKTLLIGKGVSAAESAKEVGNFYGTGGTVSGAELHSRAIAQAASLGVEFKDEEVNSVEMTGSFTVDTDSGSYDCKAVVLAVGRRRASSGVKNTDTFEGRGVSRCAVCDGFFFKNKTLGVLGAGSYAAHEAKQLMSITDKITIFTNGMEFTGGEPPCGINKQKVKSVFGEAKLGGVELENGEKILLDGLFIAVGTADALDLAKKLGLATDGGYLTVDKNGMTSCPGVFAAGDCVGGLNQISTAVGDGALAGQRAAEYISKTAE